MRAGRGGRDAASGAMSKARMSGVRSRAPRRRAGRQSSASAIYSAAAGAALARDEIVDHPARPQRAGVDVQIVERLARIAEDRALLRLQHAMVLIVDALAVVDMRDAATPRVSASSSRRKVRTKFQK